MVSPDPNNTLRHLQWSNCYNIRDIGGYPAANGKRVRWKAVLRADNLCNLTHEGREALYSYRTRTIIDLRFAHEVARAPHPFAPGNPDGYDVDYHNLPYPKETIQRAATMRMLRKALSSAALYCEVLDVGKQQVIAILNTIARARDGSVMIHCHVGKDRTGLICALLLALLGVPYPTIAEDYALSTRYLQPLIDLRAPSNPLRRFQLYRRLFDRIRCDPETMLTTLAYLDSRYGGIVPYLREGGMSEQAMLDLQGRLTES